MIIILCVNSWSFGIVLWEICTYGKREREEKVFFKILFKVKLLIKPKMLASHWNHYFNTLRLVIDWQCQNTAVKTCED